MSQHIKDLQDRLDKICMIAHYDCLNAETQAPCNKEIIQVILDSIAMEKDAEHELSYAALSMYQQNIGGNLEDDYLEFANALVAFGTQMLNELRRYKMYKNGYLPYQFLGWIQNDIILGIEKMDTDTLNARMHISRYDPDPGV